MAPRRGNHHGQNGGFIGNFMDLGFNLGLDLDHPFGNFVKCSCPSECLRENVDGLMGSAIRLDDLQDAVRVNCNNEHCQAGRFMHRECFENWEQSVLSYLKSCGRARSWSERQRHQNLWTKKGYDLAFKACACKCGRGHLKKDLDWIPPSNGQRNIEDLADSKKKKKNKNRNQKAILPGVNFNAEITQYRTASSSSSAGSVSPPVVHEYGAPSPNHSVALVISKKKPVKVDFFPDRSRNGSAGNGIFCRRQDFSAFNGLPPNKLNSYHVKVEDEGNHGNDDTRCFILSTLAGMCKASVFCVLCEQSMDVYDRYPLANGTFFLSPRQHSKSCLEVKLEGRTQFLSIVCLYCLDGRGAGRRLTCLYCAKQWNGSSLVLGTMYNYDIFAAMPCCADRLRCNNCQKPLLPPNQKLSDLTYNFSDFSHSLACPHCQAVDTHYVKPLSLCYTKDPASLLA